MTVGGMGWLVLWPVIGPLLASTFVAQNYPKFAVVPPDMDRVRTLQRGSNREQLRDYFSRATQQSHETR